MTCLVEIFTVVPAAEAKKVYLAVSSFAEYSNYTDAVREITMVSDGADTAVSQWSVNFRGGILQWTERDTFYPDAMRITYEQIDGDFLEMSGDWTVTQEGEAVRVVFTAAFDIGIPTLGPIINPVAIRALQDNMSRILRGILGDDIQLTCSGVDDDQTDRASRV